MQQSTITGETTDFRRGYLAWSRIGALDNATVSFSWLVTYPRLAEGHGVLGFDAKSESVPSLSLFLSF